MKVFMTGGTGFVGRSLTRAFLRAGHEVTILSRFERSKEALTPGVVYLQGDPTRKGEWQNRVGEHDILVNLAGESIFSRWTEESKRRLRETRILTTWNLVEAAGGGVRTLYSTSAVGYYGFHGDEILTEDSPPGTDFLARLAVNWENEALRAAGKGVRVLLTRFGIVLGEKGGALGQMVPVFEKYLGGPLGSGKQWFSWIHLEDLCRAFLFLLDHPEISGPVNLTSPNPVRNKEMAKALGKVLHRPALFSTPAFILKRMLGEFGSVLLEGQRVVPQKLLKSGFTFQYPEVEKALEDILKNWDADSPR